jgi:hypothetical protein
MWTEGASEQGAQGQEEGSDRDVGHSLTLWSLRWRWVEYVVYMEMINAYRIVVGRFRRKRPVGRMFGHTAEY